MRPWLRRIYMRSSSLSTAGSGNRGYVRFLYASWARFYDWSIGLDPAYRRNAQRMLDAAVRDGDRVLDVGIGTGVLAEYAAARSRAWTGIDYSGAMLARAARKIAASREGKVTLQWGDARTLPFDDGYFDTVVSSFVLPHFSRDERVPVLKEMLRTLRPGGRLGLFLAQGEQAPLFDTREVLESNLVLAGFDNILIEDRDDVYRVVTALRPGR